MSRYRLFRYWADGWKFKFNGGPFNGLDTPNLRFKVSTMEDNEIYGILCSEMCNRCCFIGNEDDFDLVDGMWLCRECNHAWIYENKLILTEPPQRRRICKNCGKKETIRCGIPIPVEDTYLGIVEKFKGEIKK